MYTPVETDGIIYFCVQSVGFMNFLLKNKWMDGFNLVINPRTMNIGSRLGPLN